MLFLTLQLHPERSLVEIYIHKASGGLVIATTYTHRHTLPASADSEIYIPEALRCLLHSNAVAS